MMYSPVPGYSMVMFFPDTGRGPADEGVELQSGALLLFLEEGSKPLQSDTWADMSYYSKFLWNNRVGWVFTPNLRALET